MCSSLLEMRVQSLKLIVWAVFLLEPVKCSPPRNLNSSNHENCNIKFSLKTRFLIKLSFAKFLLKSLKSHKSMLEKKVNIWTPSGYFPFFISFSCWNEINTKSSIKKDSRKMGNCNVNHILDRSSHQRCSVRKGVLRNFAQFPGKHRVRVSFLIKLQACNFINKRLWYTLLVQAFSEFCEIFKNIFFSEHLRANGSV